MRSVIGGLTRYAENPSSFSVMNYEKSTKEMLISYMSSYEATSAGGYIDDCKTGKKIMQTNAGYDDGEYCWSTQDIYHIEKYNAAVNPDFIEHIKKKLKLEKKAS